MSLRKIACRVDEDQGGRRLDQFLAEALPRQGEALSRRRIRRRIETGAVYVDGRRVRVASRRMRTAARVEIWIGETPERPATLFDATRVLFEDDDLIAVDKPPGLPAQATVTDAVHDLYHQLRRFLADRDGQGAYLALHHRLDRETSGVMIFSKRREANRGLARAFTRHRVRKLYHALAAVTTAEPPARAWTVANRLCPPRASGEGKRRAVTAGADGRRAETDFRPLRWFPGALWLEAVPRTGRTHQIRVHLADSGLPVLGDPLYGRDTMPRIPAPRLMLHAVSLTLEHPRTGEPLCIESPLPEDFREAVRLLERAPPEKRE